MSLDGRYEEDNVFAKILRGEIPCARAYEDGHVLAFMDVFPQSRGHTLVVSKESLARNILEIEPEPLSRLILGVQRVARAVRAAFDPDGVTISQFNGQAGGQTIFHLHFHIVPRWNGVALKPHGAGGMADAAELASLAKAISEQIT